MTWRRPSATNLICAALGLALSASAHAAPPDVAERQAVKRAAIDAVERLQQQNPAVRATWSGTAMTPRVVTGMRTATVGATPEARALSFVAAHPELVGVTAGQLGHMETKTSRGRTVVRFQQLHQGLPVLDRTLVITLDTSDDGPAQVMIVTSDIRTIRGPLPAATVTERTARDTAIRAAWATPEGTATPDAAARAQQVVVADMTGARVMWRVEVQRRPVVDRIEVLVDGASGDVRGLRNRAIR